MLSNACKYAIRSILYLALHDDANKKIGVKKIATELVTPQPFLSKLLQQLSKNDLVSSTKGPHGGFYLSELNLEKSVWDIIKCIDGTSKFEQCFMGLPVCDGRKPCPVHFTVAPFKEKIMKDFRDKNIKEFVHDFREKGHRISLKEYGVS